MRILKKSTIAGFCILSTLLFLAPAGCVREDTSACMQYKLNVRAVDAEGNDLTRSGTLQKVDVYIFNESGFVRMVPGETLSGFLMAHNKKDRLTLVAWGNLKEDTLVTKIGPESSIKQARLKLKKHADGCHLPITDLFYCRKELNNTSTRGMQEETVTLTMERMAAGLSIRTHYLAERYPYDGESYTFIVRGTGTKMDFTGKTAGQNARYKPLSITDEQGDVYAPPFRIFPTGNGGCLEIDIYRKQEKICTIAWDNESKPLSAVAGKQTHIDINFRHARIKAFVNVMPWEEMNQETEM